MAEGTEALSVQLDPFDMFTNALPQGKQATITPILDITEQH